ncbi:MAG: SUMF1/EgtB/PvdO family nonheme iron enzyme [Planctomycetota bacterium]
MSREHSNEPEGRPFRVFLSSPGDVGEERERARQILERVNEERLLTHCFRIEVLDWDDVWLTAHDQPQVLLATNLPRPSACDLVVVILWSRLGSPLPENVEGEFRRDGEPYTGTEWEFEEALRGRSQAQRDSSRAKPEVVVYRATRDPQRAKPTAEQTKQLERFFAKFRSRGGASFDVGVNEYGSADDFATQFDRHLRTHLAAQVQVRVRTHRDVPPTGTDEALTQLRAHIQRAEETPFSMHDETLRQVINGARHAKTWGEYWVGRVALWSGPDHELDERFVKLTLQAKAREEQERRSYPDLRAVLADRSEGAVVVLAPPGAGKTTLLRRLELEIAVDQVRGWGPCCGPDTGLPRTPGSPPDQAGTLTFLVDLGRYRVGSPAPLEWLEAQWGELLPKLPGLRGQLEHQRVLLLLDGVNELPHSGESDYGTRVRLWADFLKDLATRWPGNRAILTCREHDYSAPLSTREHPVPQVRVEPLDDDTMFEFLRCYCPEQREDLWKQLRLDAKLRDSLRAPFYLRLLAEQATRSRSVPRGRAGLFCGFLREALHRELEGGNPRVSAGELFHESDIAELTRGELEKFELPDQGPFFKQLAHFALEQQRRGGAGSHLSFDSDDLARALNSAPVIGAAAIRLTKDLGIVLEGTRRREVRFVHQLFQEFFAARALAAEPDPELARSPWRASEVPESLAATIAQLEEHEPLPGLGPTGWEETMILAAPMARDVRAFVLGLAEVNLPLAGRAAASLETRERLDAEGVRTIAVQLVARSQATAADLRARIAAGLALGELGDPRFERRTGAFGDYLLPPLVPIRGGDYRIGSDEEDGERDERPVSPVSLAPFEIGQFPVTNAEYALFVESGGYDDDQWWTTTAARAWRSGAATAEALREERRELMRSLRADPTRLENPRWTPLQRSDLRQLLELSEDEFDGVLAEWYPAGRHRLPGFWNTPGFSAPAVPVVGITWFEARAYAEWLSVQSDKRFRLPFESEWEVAARDFGRTVYPWGDIFEPGRANTYESHLRTTTPIGIFRRDGEGAIADLAGNVWEWTNSLYRPYPYLAGDGREEADAEGRRVVRGGSWSGPAFGARAACRRSSRPGVRGSNLGFRVCCGSPISL